MNNNTEDKKNPCAYLAIEALLEANQYIKLHLGKDKVRFDIYIIVEPVEMGRLVYYGA